VDSLLRRIVINLSISHYHRELSTPFAFESAEKLDTRGLLVDPAPGPERALTAEQQLDRVVTMLTAVSPRTCQILIAQRIEKHLAAAVSALGEMLPADFGLP